MQKSLLPKTISYHIGRTFNLLFNRITMYHLEHPANIQAIQNFLEALREGFKFSPSLSIILMHDKFFLDEEPLDPRIMTSKMLPYFKKAQIQSLSFEKGLSESEMKVFLKVFADAKTPSKAESIKTTLSTLEIAHLKVNYTFLQKMTEDDAVIFREDLPEDLFELSKTAHGLDTSMLKKILVEQIIMDGVDESLSIRKLIEDPATFSKTMIDTDISGAGDSKGPGTRGTGASLTLQLQRLTEEITKAGPDVEAIDPQKLADAVFAFRKDLLEGIEAQKAMGVIFANEEAIRKEINALTDQVVIRIVTEEYNQGEISVSRLAQIIRRLIPEPGEIKRLLPQLKKALLAEGMSLVEFLRLIQELGKELESEGLVQILKESADHIGLSGDDLIREVKRDPTGAAELIYLAAEIRRGSGDEKVFSEILATYVEQIGSEFALDSTAQQGEESGKNLKEVISQVESKLLSHLRVKMDSQLFGMLEKKIDDRLGEVVKQLKANLVMRRVSSTADDGIEIPALIKLIEESVDDEKGIQMLLEKVISHLRARGFEEEKLKIIADEITRRSSVQAKEPEKKTYPKGTFNRNNILFFLKKEISRAWRYRVPFSTLTLSLVNIIPATPVSSSEEIKLHEVWFAVMERLTKIMRDTDFLGALEENKILLILPMTDEKGSGLALQRFLKILHSESFIVKDIALELKFVALATSFNQATMPTIQIFLKEIQTKMNRLLALQQDVKLSL